MPSWRYWVPERQAKRSTSDKHLIFIAGVILLATLWQVLSLWIGEEKMVFPGPVATFSYAVKLLQREYTYRCILATMSRMLAGFAISFVLSLFFGIIAGNYPFMEKLFQPTIIALRAIPTASLVYLFIVLAGFKKAPMFLVILISFPIIYEGVCTGIARTPDPVMKALRVDGADFMKENLKIRIPLALPYIAVAVASSFSLCFKIEIMAEVITGASNPGLGSAIMGARADDPTNMVPVFAYSLIAVVIMLMIDFVSDMLKKKISL